MQATEKGREGTRDAPGVLAFTCPRHELIFVFILMEYVLSASSQLSIAIEPNPIMRRKSRFETNNKYMSLALVEARKSPPKPTNFCVGACLVARNQTHSEDTLLATGYTLECEGNTHAEQCCFTKFAKLYGCEEDEIGKYLPENTVLYTTMEPCSRRSVGNLPCSDRILRLKREDGRPAIEMVYVGVKEPETFVGVNEGRARLEAAGIRVEHVPSFEDEILRVATAGHPKTGNEKAEANG